MTAFWFTRARGPSWLAGELLYSGITVSLLDANETVVMDATSDEFGQVQFWGLTPGEYVVRFTTPEYYDIPQNNNIINLTVGPNTLSSLPITHQSVQVGVVSALATEILNTAKE